MPMEDMLTGLGTFKRLAATQDASRAPVAAYTDLYTNVPIRVDDLGGGQDIIYGQQVFTASHMVFSLQAMTLRNGDILVTEGLTFRLINPQLARAIGALPDHLESYMTELAP